MLQDCIAFLVSTAWVLFNYHLKKKQTQSEALLKMPTSFASMEKFCLDIQKWISLKQAIISITNASVYSNALQYSHSGAIKACKKFSSP